MSLFHTIWIALTGLAIGGFLNVVIYRGPIIWGLVEAPQGQKGNFNLAVPRSHCPHCKAQINAIFLIPLLGYALTRGRCAHCHKKIPLLYPVIELAALLASLLALWVWGFSGAAIGAFILFCFLLCLAAIDARTGYLPDALTLPLLLLGLGANYLWGFVPIADAVIGAIAGYGTLALLAFTYRRFRGRDGLGGGDAKLLGALGAWSGWMALPLILMLAAFMALIWIGLLALRGRQITATTPLPFGPALALAGALIFTTQKALPGFMF